MVDIVLTAVPNTARLALRNALLRVVLAVTVYSTVMFILLSAIVDILRAYLDPRIRVE